MREAYDENVEHFESRTAGDEKVYVKFYIRPVRDDEKSNAEGRPIYKDREYLEIRTPGNSTNIVNRPVSDMDKQRFRRQYAMFKSGMEEQTEGTPLHEVTWITRSQVEELVYLRILTIEQLAAVGDDVCTKIPGLFGLKKRAATYVENSKGAAPLLEMQRQLDELRSANAALQEAVKDQANTIQQMTAEKQAQKPATR